MASIDTENDGKNGFSREYKRSSFTGRVGYFISGEYNFAEALMISEGGMLLCTPRSLPPGTEIEVHFYILGDDFISLKGRILYCNMDKTNPQAGIHYVGLRFMGLCAEERKVIQLYVKRH